MTSEWRRHVIDQLKAESHASIAIGPFGSRMKSNTYVASGIPVIRGNNISDTKDFVDDFVFVTPEFADQLRSQNVTDGDLVFPHRGNIGTVGIVGNAQPRYVLSTSLMKLTCNRSLAEPLFLFYFFRSPAGRHKLMEHASTVGTPGIGSPLTSLRSIEVDLPPLAEQRAIAHILGTLDDKIELTRRMNRTLEGMARAIFQSWFVDFNPVRAKAAGQPPPGLAPHLATLFPDSFENSEIGALPRGWRVGQLGDIADNTRRGVSARDIAPGTPYIALEHMPRRSIALADWELDADVESNKFQFKEGDILFGKLRPYFHKVGVAPVDGVCSTDILVITPKTRDWFGFALGHLSSDELVQHADASSTGTKMPRTNWGDLALFRVALPEPCVARQLNIMIEPMVSRLHAGIHESRTLGTLRDALLPKLISGELRLADAERIAGRCV